MKKLFLLVSLVAITFSGLHAGSVDQQKAQNVGTRFLSATAVGQRNADVQLNLVSVATDLSRGAVDYYVFNVKGGEGFVIVAGDDRVKPVLAYSTTGEYNPRDVAEGFAYTLNAFQQEIHYVREHDIIATPDIVAEWKSVMATGNILPGRTARSVVGPLCQTIWNQNFPYSSQCPEDEEGSGGHVYAGCVATAMAQVMKYYDWPPQGTGSHTYNPQGYSQQTANFGDTEYHFELMPLALDSTSTEDEIFYIAQFQHHCGIAVDMQYSGSGSGAYSDDMPNALRNYFRYNCDGHVSNDNWWGWGGYTNEEWAQMLKEGGLDELIPLYYSGQDDNWQGGHAFVCDGYDENDYFHFNWGWSGRDDAWCPIGALNTTKYAFNLMNGFTGHIVPNTGEYFQRPDSVANMQVTENADFNGVILSWSNPSFDLNGNELTAIESVTLRRNFEVIATFTDAQPGIEMTYEDSNLEPGLYEYSIFVTNDAGISRTTYRSLLVGEKCPVTFVLQDEGGDGWKGAAISVTSESGQRIAVIGMEEGSEKTVVIPLLKQNLNFIWNHGWYHTTEQYDTDYECSFLIYDGYGQLLYASEALEDGIFMTYNNDCEFGAWTCYPVRNAEVEYVWEGGQIGVHLAWDKPINTDRLVEFWVIRNHVDDQPWAPVARISFTGEDHYEFFDSFAEQPAGDYTYYIRADYWRDEDESSCTASTDYFDITVTDVDENETDGFAVYPNPSNGMITIEGTGHLTVLNTLGQIIKELDLESQTTMELPRGVFFVRINGVTKKVVVE